MSVRIEEIVPGKITPGIYLGDKKDRTGALSRIIVFRAGTHGQGKLYWSYLYSSAVYEMDCLEASVGNITGIDHDPTGTE